jgi:Mn-dependent DtxR family transcriptional regulator
VFTIPRVSQAQQILRDLGLVEYDDQGVMIPTDLGRAELEACRAG